MRPSKYIAHIERILAAYSPGDRFTIMQIIDAATLDLTAREVGFALHMIPNVQKVKGHQPHGKQIWEVIA